MASQSNKIMSTIRKHRKPFQISAATLSTSLRSVCTLPQSTENLELQSPAKRRRIHSPPIPRVPNGPLNETKREKRAEQCRSILRNRDITPRLKALAALVWDKIKKAQRMTRYEKKRTAILEDIEVMGNEVESRWDEVHGPEGLCQKIIDSSQTLSEWRMVYNYGDYLAHNLTYLMREEEALKNLAWKTDNLDWLQVVKRLDEEKTKVREWRQTAGRGEPSGLKIVEDIKLAAEHTGQTRRQLEYEIRAYAARNRLCHSGVKEMAEHARFEELARQLVDDIEAVPKVFKSQPEEIPKMTNALITFRDHNFKWLKKMGNDIIRFELTDDASKRRDRAIERELAAAQNAAFNGAQATGGQSNVEMEKEGGEESGESEGSEDSDDEGI